MQGLTTTLTKPSDDVTVEFGGSKSDGVITIVADGYVRLPGTPIRDESVTLGIELDGVERLVIDIVPDRDYIRVRALRDVEIQHEPTKRSLS